MFEEKILKWLLPKLLNKKKKSSIYNPYQQTDSDDNVESWYVVYLESLNGGPSYLVDSYNTENQTLGVFAPNENDIYCVEASMHLSAATQHDITTRCSYLGHSIEYKNLYKLYLFYLIPIYKIKTWLKIKLGIITQSYFNRRDYVVKENIRILQHIVEKYTINEEIMSLNILHELYTSRIFSHPNLSKIQKNLDLHLSALVENNDLNYDSTKRRYSLLGKAVITIAEHNKEQKRYKEAIYIQRAVMVLTGIIAFSAVIQALSHCNN